MKIFLLLILLSGLALIRSTVYDEANAVEYLKNLSTAMNAHIAYIKEAVWNYQTNITDENQRIQNEAFAKFAKIVKEIGRNGSMFNWKEFESSDVRRQFKISVNLGYSILPAAEHKEFRKILTEMQSNWAGVRVCQYKNWTKCDLPIEPEINEIFAMSRDPNELSYYWQKFYEKAGTAVRQQFEHYIEFNTKAAKLNNFTSGAERWLSQYTDDDENFEQTIKDVFTELRPLYAHLHGYVRHRLKQYYGGELVSETGPIPMHLLGNVWAQDWSPIADLVMPFPNKSIVNVTDEMVRQGYTPLKMFQVGDDFFTSMNLTKLPEDFWQKSILEKPSDGRDLICHASAWDFHRHNDVRIKQCTLVKPHYLNTIHHELGHIQYFLQYQHLPSVFRTGANPGFHEAVGDVLALSVSTPKHLQRIGLLKDYIPDREARINQLFSTALHKIVFLPFAYTVDKYRWALFRGEIQKEDWNCAFWKLREEFSGIEPPVVRTERDFDAPAKYHVSNDVEYLRYVVAYILQFQFYKSACIMAGQYDPTNPELPLDNCDFYGSTKVGDAFRAMLSLGASKPWPDALEAFTGERAISGKAIAEYFEPVRVWLEAENIKNNVHIGWTTSDKCVK